MKKRPPVFPVVAGALLMAGCASIDGASGMVRAPRLRPSAEHPAELALQGSGAGTLHAWARVKNANGYPVTLAKVHGALFLAGTRAGIVDLKTNIQLKAREEKTVPLDLVFGAKEKDREAKVGGTAGAEIPYRLDAVMTVVAGEKLEPTFGPVTLLEGQARIR